MLEEATCRQADGGGGGAFTCRPRPASHPWVPRRVRAGDGRKGPGAAAAPRPPPVRHRPLSPKWGRPQTGGRVTTAQPTHGR